MSAGIEEALARKLSALRITNGLTYQQLADRLSEHGVTLHQSAVQKTEKSGRGVTIPELIGYSRIYNISVGDLLDEDCEAIDAEALAEVEEIELLAQELTRKLRALL